MPAVSKQDADRVERLSGLERRFAQIDGFTVIFESYTEDRDFASLVKGLPNDLCPAPHWGYLLKGKLVYKYGDGTEEVFTAGQAYYARPGHTAWVGKGTELVKFSPTDQLKKIYPITRENLAEMVA